MEGIGQVAAVVMCAAPFIGGNLRQGERGNHENDAGVTASLTWPPHHGRHASQPYPADKKHTLYIIDSRINVMMLLKRCQTQGLINPVT